MPDTALHRCDSQDLREWACDTIGIPIDTAADTFRASLLRRLAAADFLPPDDWHDAVDVLLATPQSAFTSVPEGYYEHRGSELRLEVARFAATYFDLPRDARRHQWEELSQKCAPWSPLRLWLLQLQAGLDVEWHEDHNRPASTEQFARMVCEDFLNAPGPARRETCRKLAIMRSEHGHWEVVAAAFHHDHPDIANLSPALVQEFADFTSHHRWAVFAASWRRLFKGGWFPESSDSPLTLKHYLLLFVVLTSISVIPVVIASFESAKMRRATPQIVPYAQPKPFEPISIGLDPREVKRIRDLGDRATASEKELLHLHEIVTRLPMDAGIVKMIRQSPVGSKQPTADGPLPPSGSTPERKDPDHE